jgi:hopanoid biosynthesis associated protein HpnK
VKQLILTGDDFGLDVPVNEAVEEAHCRGVLTAASLMVGATAAADAVERTRRLPRLRIGLHVVLVEGRPVLPASEVPDLVDGRGEFSTRLVRSGFRFFFLPRVRRQMEAEIRAQFRAFRETGLPLDHADTHNHLHLHPTLLGLVLRVGREFGLRAVRLPREPAVASWRAAGGGLAARAAPAVLLAPLLASMKVRMRRAGVRFNDHLFGMRDCGRMEEGLVLRQIRELPEGVSEMHFHAATRPSPILERTMPGYRHQAELAALVSPAVRTAIVASGARRVAFSDLADR